MFNHVNTAIRLQRQQSQTQVTSDMSDRDVDMPDLSDRGSNNGQGRFSTTGAGFDIGQGPSTPTNRAIPPNPRLQAGGSFQSGQQSPWNSSSPLTQHSPSNRTRQGPSQDFHGRINDWQPSSAASPFRLSRSYLQGSSPAPSSSQESITANENTVPLLIVLKDRDKSHAFVTVPVTNTRLRDLESFITKAFTQEGPSNRAPRSLTGEIRRLEISWTGHDAHRFLLLRLFCQK